MMMAAAAVAASGKGGYSCLQEVHLWSMLAVGIVMGFSIALIVAVVRVMRSGRDA